MNRKEDDLRINTESQPHWLKYHAVLLLIVAWVSPVFPQVTANEKYEDAITRSRKMIIDYKTRGNVPGISVAVGINGAVVWSEGFGHADLENHVLVSPSTKFRIGSISKPMTAAAVGLLVEGGILNVDAVVQQYVPEFPGKRGPITTRLLAGHLAGIRHYRGREFYITRRYSTVSDGLEIFMNDTLLFMPGTRYSYSSYGWNLISAVVEGASGEKFLDFMQTHVFEPLEMHSTTADYSDSLIEYRSRFYEVNSSMEILNAPFVDNSYKWAGGGFLSNPEDLIRFGTAHLGPGFLKQETLNMLFTSQQTADGTKTGYGIGWTVGEDAKGRTWRGHGGGSVGGTSFLIIYPQSGLVLAIAANISNGRFGDLPRNIARTFIEQD